MFNIKYSLVCCVNTSSHSVQHKVLSGKMYLHNILGKYFLLNIVVRFIYIKYGGILSVEHCGKIYLHNILGNTFCWTLLDYLFTQNTGITFCWTLGRFIYTKYHIKYSLVFCINKFSHSAQHKVFPSILCK
jgi:hypothetical protein